MPRCLTVALVPTALSAPVLAGAALYSQPSDRPAQASFYSDAVPGQFFSQRMADNFTLASAGSATALRWWGGSQNFQFADTNNMASYTVVLYASDNLGAPDIANILFQQTVDSESNGFEQLATGATNIGGGTEYRYTLQLDAALALDAGVQYWISVGATLINPGADAWVWSGSTVGDLANATDYFTGAGYTVYDPSFNDLAFEIIPAPGPVALLAFAGLAGTRRRR